MKRIFISYRHADTSDWVYKLGLRLQAVLPHDRIFFDIAIRPGANFAEALDAQLSRCDLALVVIGPNWFGRIDESSRRIDEQNDFVRLEIERLLAREIPVVPVLVDNALMPDSSALPQSMTAL